MTRRDSFHVFCRPETYASYCKFPQSSIELYDLLIALLPAKNSCHAVGRGVSHWLPSAVWHRSPHLLYPFDKPSGLNAWSRFSKPREVKRVATTLADRALQATDVTFAMLQTVSQITRVPNLFSADATVIVPIAHTAGSRSM